MASKPQMWWPGINRLHPLARGLVAFWPLWEGAGAGIRNVMGHYHGLLVSPDTAEPWGPGLEGRSILFGGGGSGDHDRIEAGTWDLPGDHITMIVRARREGANPTDQRMLSKAEGSGVNAHYWMIGIVSTTSLRTRIKISGTTQTDVTASQVIADEWHDYGATFDGVNVRHYRDGLQVGIFAHAGVVTGNPLRSVEIGRNAGAVPYGTFDGRIEYAMVSGRAFTDQEMLRWSGDPYAVLHVPSIARRHVAAAGVPVTMDMWHREAVRPVPLKREVVSY